VNKIKILFFVFALFMHSFSLAGTQLLCEKHPSLNNFSMPIDMTCNAIIQSDVCKKVPRDDLMSCSPYEINSNFDAWELLKGCSAGFFESTKDILNFIWNIMEWIGLNIYSSEEREKSSEKLADLAFTVREASLSSKEYLQSTKLYLHTEYAKAYALASPPLRVVKALSQMTSAIGKIVYNAVYNLIGEKVAAFGCLKFESQSKYVCRIFGDIIMPPTAVLGLIKHGSKSINIFPAIEKAFEKHMPIFKYKKVKYDKPKAMRGYIGEEEGKHFDGSKVVYLNEVQRLKYKVTVKKDGLLYDSKGVLINNSNGIYVMDEMGDIYIHSKEVGKFHHSSFLAGGPVAAAGEIKIKDGVIKFIDRSSGHYHPEPQHFNQVLEELKSRNVKPERVDNHNAYPPDH
jgi:hypothetical protein